MKNKVNTRFICIMIGFIITITFLHEIWYQLKLLNIRTDQIVTEIELTKLPPLPSHGY